MPNSKLARDVRLARLKLWWDRNDAYFYVVVLCICCAVAGAFTMSFVDRAERMELMRAHSDEIAHFRQSCRAVVDERDERVRESTGAAASAAQAASSATRAAADALGEVKRATPAAKATPAPDLGSAVREANKQIEGVR